MAIIKTADLNKSLQSRLMLHFFPVEKVFSPTNHKNIIPENVMKCHIKNHHKEGKALLYIDLQRGVVTPTPESHNGNFL